MTDKDLISREAAIEWFFRPYSNEESYSNIDVEMALNAIPAVDAIPVEWLNKQCEMADDRGDMEMTDAISWLIQTWQEEQDEGGIA